MTVGKPAICFACKRFTPGFTGPACTAFPDGIPAQIIGQGFDHRKPFPGDGGQRFVRDADKPLPPGYPERLDTPEPVILADPGVIRLQTKKELRETAKRIINAFRDHPERP